MKRRKIVITIAFMLSCLSFLTIFLFTSANGDDSNNMSRSVARLLQNVSSRFFDVNPRDFFWSHTLNEIIRKIGHFSEYCFAGTATSLFFLLLFRKKWIALLSSMSLCALMASFDEFRQQFIQGRTPRFYDVVIDVTGAVTGMLVIFLVYYFYKMISKLKRRITALENNAAMKVKSAGR